MSESRTLTSERGIRAGAWERKSGHHSERRQVLRRRKRASKDNLPGRSRSKRERESGRKRSAKSWFHSGDTAAKTERESEKRREMVDLLVLPRPA